MNHKRPFLPMYDYSAERVPDPNFSVPINMIQTRNSHQPQPFQPQNFNQSQPRTPSLLDRYNVYDRSQPVFENRLNFSNNQSFVPNHYLSSMPQNMHQHQSMPRAGPSAQDPTYVDLMSRIRNLESQLSAKVDADLQAQRQKGPVIPEMRVKPAICHPKQAAAEVLSFLEQIKAKDSLQNNNRPQQFIGIPTQSPPNALRSSSKQSMKVVGTYQPATSTSDKVYAVPLKTVTENPENIKKILNVGTPIISKQTNSYGRVFPVQQQVTMMPEKPPMPKNESVTPVKPVGPTPFDFAKAFEVVRQDESNDDDYDDSNNTHRFASSSQNDDADMASKVRSKFQEMLVKYSLLRQSKEKDRSNNNTNFAEPVKQPERSDSVRRRTLMTTQQQDHFKSSQGASKHPHIKKERKVPLEEYSTCPMISEDQVQPFYKSRIDLIREAERKEMVAFKCYTFGELPTSDVEQLGYSTTSTQAWLTRHFKTMLPLIGSETPKIHETCSQMHMELFCQLESLAQCDKCYETCIWDYDPRFTVDYLPKTKRGIDNVPCFVHGVSYTDDENKWRKYTTLLDTISKNKVYEQVKKSDPESNDLAIMKISAPDQPEDRAYKLQSLINEQYRFPEYLISEDYCGICDNAFSSLITSISHYNSMDHLNEVLDEISQAGSQLLLELDPYCDPVFEIRKQWFLNVIRSIVKKYKIKPEKWMCDLCDVSLTSKQHAQQHFSGTSHKKKAGDSSSFQQQMIRTEINMRKNAIFDDVEIPRKKLRSVQSKQLNSAVVMKSAKRTGYRGSFGYH